MMAIETGGEIAHQAGYLSLLGIYTKFASASEIGGGADALIERFYLQSLARELVGEQRVSFCLRWLSPQKENVQIRVNDADGRCKACYGNLVVCGSVWACPVCAARITEQRRHELGEALAKWHRKRKQVVMVTYTLAHHSDSCLSDVLKVLKGARRRFKSGRRWQALQAAYHIVGTIGALEVTWGENGWHPHIHELVFFDTRHDVDWLMMLENSFKQMWIGALQKEGGTAIRDIGIKLVLSNAKIGDYVAKFGRERSKESKWELEHEMAKNPTKRGRDNDHATPTELLIGYGNGSELAGKLWREYAIAFHGKQQLVWSVGLKKLLNVAEKGDSEIVEGEGLDYQVLATIPAKTWYRLLKRENRNGWRGKLLKVAIEEGIEGVNRFIGDD